MSHDKYPKAFSVRSDDPERQRVLEWQDDVARSTAPESPRPAVQATPAEPVPAQIVINQVVNPAVVVTRVKPPEQKTSDEISTRTLVGTILGATAGAVVAYAMSKGDAEGSQPPEFQRKITYRTVEAPSTQDPVRQETVTRYPDHGTRSNHGSLVNSKPASRAITVECAPRTYVETLVGPSQHSSCPTHTIVRSGSDGAAFQTNGCTRIPVAEPRDSPASHASSSKKTPQANMVPLPHSVVTETRSAKDIPLPSSQVASLASRNRKGSGLDELRTPVNPRDSVSQVSTRRSGKPKDHHAGSRSGSEKGRGHGSERGSKADPKKGMSSKISGTRSHGLAGAIGF